MYFYPRDLTVNPVPEKNIKKRGKGLKIGIHTDF
jgi:hypothetical protein